MLLRLASEEVFETLGHKDLMLSLWISPDSPLVAGLVVLDSQYWGPYPASHFFLFEQWQIAWRFCLNCKIKAYITQGDTVKTAAVSYCRLEH